MSRIKQLKKEIQRKRKLLDLLRKILGLMTLKEKAEMELMIREMAKEKGLREQTTDILVAVIKCESGLNPRAINKNSNGTIDYGLCQFNDYWYHNIISPEVALNNPKKAVEVMIEQLKKNRANDWICYRSKKYKEFL